MFPPGLAPTLADTALLGILVLLNLLFHGCIGPPAAHQVFPQALLSALHCTLHLFPHSSSPSQRHSHMPAPYLLPYQSALLSAEIALCINLGLRLWEIVSWASDGRSLGISWRAERRQKSRRDQWTGVCTCFRGHGVSSSTMSSAGKGGR